MRATPSSIVAFSAREAGSAAGEKQVGHGRLAAQVGAGTLPVSVGSSERSMTSSSSWKATPTFSPYSSAGRRYSDGASGEDAGLSGCRDQRSGLVGQHLEVELDGVLAGLSADRLVHLSEDETLERVGLQTDRAFADLRHELAGAREHEVAGEDGDVVERRGRWAPRDARPRRP
jgi:hypothetical protein